uniref:DUF1618 domain-containing protein n=1 Tax=Setaria viridis TaxID=4556 RepID=A0A4U6TI96_SETVI|nr:hypothetical protein SEVIR_8G140100v2 [Setaria viridis]
MSVAVFPSWVLLEPFIFRKDDDESFPDEREAPIRATGTTSWGAQFRITFSLAKPPQISRLYAQLSVPGFLDRNMGNPLSIVETHRHLALVRVATWTSEMVTFPLDRLPISGNRTGTSTICYRAVSVVDRGRALKFINITRHDGIPFEALKPGTGFTITCHTLVLGRGSMAWKEDYTVTSGELWEANTPERLPRCILMFPQVDIDRPHVVHFLYIEFGYYARKKMWVVSIDMSTKTVKSFSLYINGHEGLKTDDADLIDLIEQKSVSPWPFLPCEFPKFLNLSSYLSLNRF